MRGSHAGHAAARGIACSSEADYSRDYLSLRRNRRDNNDEGGRRVGPLGTNSASFSSANLEPVVAPARIPAAIAGDPAPPPTGGRDPMRRAGAKSAALKEGPAPKFPRRRVLCTGPDDFAREHLDIARKRRLLRPACGSLSARSIQRRYVPFGLFADDHMRIERGIQISKRAQLDEARSNSAPSQRHCSSKPSG